MEEHKNPTIQELAAAYQARQQQDGDAAIIAEQNPALRDLSWQEWGMEKAGNIKQGVSDFATEHKQGIKAVGVGVGTAIAATISTFLLRALLKQAGILSSKPAQSSEPIIMEPYPPTEKSSEQPAAPKAEPARTSQQPKETSRTGFPSSLIPGTVKVQNPLEKSSKPAPTSQQPENAEGKEEELEIAEGLPPQFKQPWRSATTSSSAATSRSQIGGARKQPEKSTTTTLPGSTKERAPETAPGSVRSDILTKKTQPGSVLPIKNINLDAIWRSISTRYFPKAATFNPFAASVQKLLRPSTSKEPQPASSGNRPGSVWERISTSQSPTKPLSGTAFQGFSNPSKKMPTK